MHPWATIFCFISVHLENEIPVFSVSYQSNSVLISTKSSLFLDCVQLLKKLFKLAAYFSSQKEIEVKKIDTQQLARSIENDLLDQYGSLLAGDALRRSMGFPSMAAFHKAIQRDLLPIPIFQLKDRRGRFALAKDVAFWLAEQRNSVMK